MKVSEENNMPVLRFPLDVPDPISRRLRWNPFVELVEEVALDVFEQQTLDPQQRPAPLITDLEIGDDIVRPARQSQLYDLNKARSLHAAMDRKTAESRRHQQPARSNRSGRVLHHAEDRLHCAVQDSPGHGLAAAVPVI